MSAFTSSDVPLHASAVAGIDLVNSLFTDHLGSGRSVDRVDDDAWQRWFLDRHRLDAARTPVSEGELAALRDCLRRVLKRWSSHDAPARRDVQMLDRLICRVAVRHRVSLEGSRLALVAEPLQRDFAWVLAEVAASVIELMRVGEPDRLRECANPACSWIFYDETANRSKRYCSPTPCASLLRVRRHRQRA